jgi:hypothetical protein
MGKVLRLYVHGFDASNPLGRCQFQLSSDEALIHARLPYIRLKREPPTGSLESPVEGPDRGVGTWMLQFCDCRLAYAETVGELCLAETGTLTSITQDRSWIVHDE